MRRKINELPRLVGYQVPEMRFVPAGCDHSGRFFFVFFFSLLLEARVCVGPHPPPVRQTNLAVLACGGVAKELRYVLVFFRIF